MRKLLLLTTAVSLSVSAFAFQPKSSLLLASKSKTFSTLGDGSPKGVVKINLFGFMFRNFALQGEYGFHKNMSGCLGFNFMLPGGMPGQIPASTTKDMLDNGFSNLLVSGYSITPEFRFYPGAKDENQAPHGFYIAPYLRYGRYGISTDYTLKNGTTTETANARVSYGGMGLGLMLGSQWLIGEHFAIDWYILGMHGGSGSLDLSMTHQSIGTLSAASRIQIETELNAAYGSAATVTISGNTATVSAPTPYFGIRSVIAGGLCLGYAF